jgi:hypothetical protein
MEKNLKQKAFFIFYTPIDLPNNLPEYCNIKLKHPV